MTESIDWDGLGCINKFVGIALPAVSTAVGIQLHVPTRVCRGKYSDRERLLDLYNTRNDLAVRGMRCGICKGGLLVLFLGRFGMEGD